MLILCGQYGAFFWCDFEVLGVWVVGGWWRAGGFRHGGKIAPNIETNCSMALNESEMA